MTKRDVLSVALRVLGVMCIIYSITFIVQLVIAVSMVLQQSFPAPDPYWYLGVSIAAPVLILCVASVLLRSGDVIAQRLIPVDSELPPLGPGEWERPVFTIALRIIGVVCLVKGIPDLVRPVTVFALRGTFRPLADVHTWAGLAAALVLLVLGGYFISGGKRLVAFVYREKAADPTPAKAH